MAEHRAQWTQVLDEADAETAALILQLQFEDLAVAEDDIGAQTTSALQDGNHSCTLLPQLKSTNITNLLHSDQAIARNFQENVLKEYQKSRQIELPKIDKDQLKAALAPAKPQSHVVLFNCISCEDRFDADHCYQVRINASARRLSRPRD